MIKFQLEGDFVEDFYGNVDLSRVWPYIAVPNYVQATGEDQHLDLKAWVARNGYGDKNKKEPPEHEDRVVVFGPRMPWQAQVFSEYRNPILNAFLHQLVDTLSHEVY